jgi:hypothetical protein
MRDLGIVKKEGGSRMGNGQAPARRPVGVVAAIGVWHIFKFERFSNLYGFHI